MSRRSALARAAAAVAVLVPCIAHGQTEKEINTQYQVWVSLNSTTRFTDRVGLIGDCHVRRNDFLEDPSFYLLRVGAHFWITEKLTASFGYAHMWVAPAREDWHTWTNENRIYEQVQYASKVGKASMLQRFRNEQRWRQKVEDDVLTGENTFSDRIRYLLSLTVPVSEKPSVPSLVFSDELLVQFGSDVVLNTFDQNRFFAGIRKRMSRDWSFDLGYMLVYQQKSTGYQYDLNHTLRWFFYLTPDCRAVKGSIEPAGNEE
jgi:hypothetical protein